MRTCVNCSCNVLLCKCNRVYLHTVFVLLYSVCRSVSVLSCVDVIQSFTYGLRVIILDVTKRRGVRESAKESKRRYQRHLADTIEKEKKRINQEYVAVARLLLPSSSLLLHRPFT